MVPFLGDGRDVHLQLKDSDALEGDAVMPHRLQSCWMELGSWKRMYEEYMDNWTGFESKIELRELALW